MDSNIFSLLSKLYMRIVFQGFGLNWNETCTRHSKFIFLVRNSEGMLAQNKFHLIHSIFARLMVLVVACSFIATSFGQDFEGVIDFYKIRNSESVHFKYFVKDENVRIEEYGDDEELDGIELINTKTGDINALSVERKMYIEAKNRRPARTANITIEKTKTTKTIAGKKCTKWVVNCEEQGRKVVYWVTKGDYNFLNPLLKALNRAEKTAVYWQMIDGTNGFFPMLAEEYNSQGVLISKLETRKVVPKTIDKTKFEIPAGYTKFEKHKG